MSQQTTFPPQAFFKKNYETRLVTLTPPKPQSITVYGDFLDVIETNADLNRVYIWFNEQDSNPRLRLNNALGATTPFHKIILDWEDSENGKTITFLIGREFSFRILRGIITLAQDLVGLARESTLQSVLGLIARESTLQSVLQSIIGLTATDYNILSLDLSTSRNDVLIASNVIFLKVLESTTSNASYTIKLFDPSKPGLTQSILPPGAQIERLRRASIYVSNPPQPGSKLDLLVFIG